MRVLRLPERCSNCRRYGHRRPQCTFCRCGEPGKRGGGHRVLRRPLPEGRGLMRLKDSVTIGSGAGHRGFSLAARLRADSGTRCQVTRESWPFQVEVVS